MKPAQTAQNSLVEIFVRQAILNMAKKNISRLDRHVIHADLVPKFSEHVIEEHLQRGPQVYKEIEAKRFAPHITEMPVMQTVPKSPLEQVQEKKETVQTFDGRPQERIQNTQPTQKRDPYAAIQFLLTDTNIAAIECVGPNTELHVIKYGGQKQTTKITLTTKEINQILTRYSEEAHVPLMEGVFRVQVNGQAVNAVISELIGTKFVIKKIGTN